MKNIILLILTVLSLSSCDSLKVFYEHDKTVDFTQYKTAHFYGWADDSDAILNRFDKRRIENAFTTEFKNRGLTFVEDSADMVISLYIITKQKTETTAYTTQVGGYGGYGYGGYYGYGPGWGWGGGYGTTTYVDRNYSEGTLVVSVYDAQKKELIWEGVAQGTIDEDQVNREYKIKKTISYLMRKYPVKPLR